MNGSPFFSIVIPTYNRADIILNTVKRVAEQTFRDFEIIVVDDGSKDDTFSKLNALSKKYSFLKILPQENKERGAARNHGFNNASGQYVVFFDSDDIMHPNHLQVLSENIHKQNFPAFIATKFDFVDEAGNHRPSDIKNLSEGLYDYRLFLNGNPLACNICVKRKNTVFLFEEDRRYAIKEDWMFLIQNMRKEQLFIIDEVTISMLDHPERSMRSDNKSIIGKTILAAKWIENKVTLSDQEKKQLYAHVNYFCAIHAYLESSRREGMQFIFSAFKNGGLKFRYMVMFLKIIIGKKLIRGNR